MAASWRRRRFIVAAIAAADVSGVTGTLDAVSGTGSQGGVSASGTASCSLDAVTGTGSVGGISASTKTDAATSLDAVTGTGSVGEVGAALQVDASTSLGAVTGTGSVGDVDAALDLGAGGYPAILDLYRVQGVRRIDAVAMAAAVEGRGEIGFASGRGGVVARSEAVVLDWALADMVASGSARALGTGVETRVRLVNLAPEAFSNPTDEEERAALAFLLGSDMRAA